MKFKLSLFASLIFILLAVACTTMPADEFKDLKQKIIDANVAVNSFKFSSDRIMKMEKADETMEMIMNMEGAFDRDSQKFAVIGEASVGEEIKMPIEMYCDGEHMYINQMGQWTKMEIGSEAFNMQDQAKSFMEFLDVSDIETKETLECYEVSIVPNLEVMLKMMEKNSAIPIGEEMPEEMKTMLEELFKDFHITYFVDKNTFIADKIDIEYTMNIEDALITTKMDYVMTEINEPQDIADVPAEAKENAVDMTELQQAMIEGMSEQETE